MANTGDKSEATRAGGGNGEGTGDPAFTSLGATGYFAPRDLEDRVKAEVGEVSAQYGRLVLSPGPAKVSHWTHNLWYDPLLISVDSIGDAARKLRHLGRNWWLYDYTHHRRAELIQKKLPYCSFKPLRFPEPAPQSPLGSWMLIDRDTIIASPHCSSVFPGGEVEFEEDREGPPNRAYLKLWEAFTRLGMSPGPNDSCVDLGAAPGGWSWVLGNLDANVQAIDRSPLSPHVDALPTVHWQKGDGFSFTPEKSPEAIDWLFSDMACYPEKLLTFVKRWVSSGKCRHILCSVKFQGDTHYGTIPEFAQIEGSRLFHLTHNKHELTWFWQQPEAG